MHQDVIVIGSGPAGVAAAIEGATQGMRVLLVDDGSLTTAGVLRGHALDFHQLRENATQGARARARGASGGYDRVRRRWADARARAARQAEAGLRRIRSELSVLGVRVEAGPAELLDAGRVRVGDGSVRGARVVLLAARCRPCHPRRFFGGGSRIVHDPVSILQLEAPPRSLLVIGAEEEGCELASLFAGLGSAVTLLDRRRRMLRYVDREVVELFHRGLHGMGVEVALGETLERVEPVSGDADLHAVARLGSGRVQRWEYVVVSAGRVPELDGLALERVGVELDGAGFVLIDDLHRTTVPGVFAAGEATSGCLQTHGLPREGREAMRHALGSEAEVREPTLVGILSIPEIAMAGLSEEMCARLDVPHAVGTARFGELALPGLRGDDAGLLKLVVDRASRRLVGAHVIGADARDLVQRALGALRHEESVDDMARGAVASPSFSEAYTLAADRCRRALAAEAADGPSVPPETAPARASGLDAW